MLIHKANFEKYYELRPGICSVIIDIEEMTNSPCGPRWQLHLCVRAFLSILIYITDTPTITSITAPLITETPVPELAFFSVILLVILTG